MAHKLYAHLGKLDFQWQVASGGAEMVAVQQHFAAHCVCSPMERFHIQGCQWYKCKNCVEFVPPDKSTSAKETAVYTSTNGQSRQEQTLSVGQYTEGMTTFAAARMWRWQLLFDQVLHPYACVDSTGEYATFLNTRFTIAPQQEVGSFPSLLGCAPKA